MRNSQNPWTKTERYNFDTNAMFDYMARMENKKKCISMTEMHTRTIFFFLVSLIYSFIIIHLIIEKEFSSRDSLSVFSSPFPYLDVDFPQSKKELN